MKVKFSKPQRLIIMKNFSMLLANNNRSKAYLQTLIKNKIYPSNVLVLINDNIKQPEQLSKDIKTKDNRESSLIRSLEDLEVSFDENEHILTTLNKNKIKYKRLNTLDVNSDETYSHFQSIPEEYVVYSGPGGSILSERLINIKKIYPYSPRLASKVQRKYNYLL